MENKLKILITGGSGYVARSIYKYLKYNYDITIINRDIFDLTDREATNNWFENKYFDVVIHTAIKGGSRLKEDSLDITHLNISMFYNLLNNKHCYNRLINLGSGAELGCPSSPYGLSKNIIYNLVNITPNFYNIRIFAVFDENEIETRFIKSNIIKYINQQPLKIYQNKKMDFFYMEDLIKIIKYYLKGYSNFDPPPKNINCSYFKKYSLLDISNIINNLSNYKCKIDIDNNEIDNSYIGEYNTPQIENNFGPQIKYIGLEEGIKTVYNKLKK